MHRKTLSASELLLFAKNVYTTNSHANGRSCHFYKVLVATILGVYTALRTRIFRQLAACGEARINLLLKESVCDTIMRRLLNFSLQVCMHA